MKYDYKCLDCQHTFEIEHSMKEDKDSLNLSCSECESKNLSRYYGNTKRVVVRFYGGGWGRSQTALPPHLRNNPRSIAAYDEMNK